LSQAAPGTAGTLQKQWEHHRMRPAVSRSSDDDTVSAGGRAASDPGILSGNDRPFPQCPRELAGYGAGHLIWQILACRAHWARSVHRHATRDNTASLLATHSLIGRLATVAHTKRHNLSTENILVETWGYELCNRRSTRRDLVSHLRLCSYLEISRHMAGTLST